MNQRYPSALLENAVNELASLPGVGRKTALRLALYMLRRDVGYTENFAAALVALRRDVKYCKVCHNICDDEVCSICANPSRDHSLVCVVENIKEKSAQVMDAANVLDSDATETSTTMEQVEQAVNDIAEGATTQAGETQRAEEHVVEMGNMVQETSDEVEKLLAFAQEMQECTSQASDILQALEKVNARAEEHIDIIAEQTNTTNEAAMKISEATHLITSIAEETNLLALNASIEAARAGEQGKGFGVVASEIQKLAEQTNESATHIEEIVQELLRDAEKAVETMYGVKEIMHTQSDHVEQTESAFEQVQSGVEQSIEGINRISEHTTRLNDAREKVVGIVQNLTSIAEANAAGTEQTSASATEVGAIMEDISGKSTAMRQAAQELDDGMNIFKL